MCDRKGDMISIYCVATTVNIILYFVFVVTIEKCKQYKICFILTEVNETKYAFHILMVLLFNWYIIL